VKFLTRSKRRLLIQCKRKQKVPVTKVHIRFSKPKVPSSGGFKGESYSTVQNRRTGRKKGTPSHTYIHTYMLGRKRLKYRQKIKRKVLKNLRKDIADRFKV
jgi:hypothetical protein